MDLMGLSHGRMTGGFKHLDYDFPFHIWDGIILPIDELIFFRETTKQQLKPLAISQRALKHNFNRP
jgi:hypothetical protein